MPIYRIAAPSSVTRRATQNVGGPVARNTPTGSTSIRIPTINIHTTDGKLAGGGATVSDDSVVDQEIRRQKERDAEIIAERRLLGTNSGGTRSATSSSSPSHPAVSTSSSRSNNDDNNNDNDNDDRLDRMRQFNGDSFMFREFEEQQRREEEIKRLRQRGNSRLEESVSLSISNTETASRSASETDRRHQIAEDEKRGNSRVNGGAVSFSSPIEPSDSFPVNGNAKADGEDYDLRLSTLSLDADYATGNGNENQNNERSGDEVRESKADPDGKGRKKSSPRSAFRVQPYTDPDDLDYSKPAAITPRDETLIEREVRLIRQREGSLRRVRGYPSESRDNNQKTVEVVPVSGGFGRRLQASQYTRSPIPAAWKKDSQPPPTVEEGEEREESDNEEEENGDAEDISMKRLATNRLRLEILRERQREIDLRSQGKIHTISEERIGRPPLLADLIAADERKARNVNTTAMTNGKSHVAATPPHKSIPGISVSEVKPKVEQAEEMQIRGVLKLPKVKVNGGNVDDGSRSMSNDRVAAAGATVSGTTAAAAAERPSTVTTSRGRLVGERLIEEEVQELKRREKELREQRRQAGIDDGSAPQHAVHISAKPVRSYRRF